MSGRFRRCCRARRALSGPIERLINQSGLKITVGTLVMASALLGCVGLPDRQWSDALHAGGARHSTAVREHSLHVRPLEAHQALREVRRAVPGGDRADGASAASGTRVSDGDCRWSPMKSPTPVGAEFKLLYDRQNFGMPLGDALKGMAERVPILDARFFTTAVLTQRETGGNLSEILDNLAAVIRERFKVKRQVRAVTAHGRITGWILAAHAGGAGVDSQRGVTGAHEDDDHRSARDQDDRRRRARCR